MAPTCVYLARHHSEECLQVENEEGCVDLADIDTTLNQSWHLQAYTKQGIIQKCLQVENEEGFVDLADTDTSRNQSWRLHVCT